jgi:molybdate transport system substrate-binding protein
MRWTMMRNFKSFLATAVGFTLLALASIPAHAGEVQVAVAANFTEPAKDIAAAFTAATGHKALLSFGASGQLYAQITHGAPYQLFLSADAERAQRAEADGLAVAGSRFTYAVGRLALYSKSLDLADGAKVLKTGRFEHLAVADPAAAPYGLAAAETLRKLGLYDQLKPKLVTGANITQTYQFVATGAAELGFVAYSQVIHEKAGSVWLPPRDAYAPIAQQAVLLKTGAAEPAAKAFIAFLKGRAAQAIIERYGYQVR